MNVERVSIQRLNQLKKSAAVETIARKFKTKYKFHESKAEALEGFSPSYQIIKKWLQPSLNDWTPDKKLLAAIEEERVQKVGQGWQVIKKWLHKDAKTKQIHSATEYTDANTILTKVNTGNISDRDTIIFKDGRRMEATQYYGHHDREDVVTRQFNSDGLLTQIIRKSGMYDYTMLARAKPDEKFVKIAEMHGDKGNMTREQIFAAVDATHIFEV